ncbi:hypothetical protein [Rhodococcus sp. NPDC127528]|uniref:hypothetical protein n=1 Tax=unclassified Rhodococcus (in: high G+C Gram-positive bacteria) TaxID=192944 RepID=UPI00363C1B9D
MTQWLRLVERRRGPTGAVNLAVEDYDTNPQYCRHGIWIGTRTDSTETVEFSCPAGSPSNDFPDGTILLAAESAGLLYPDVDSHGHGTEPQPGTVRPVLTCPGVTYTVTRFDDEYRISFTIAAGTDPVELVIGALPSGRDCSELEPTTLQLAGCVFTWSDDDLSKERRCKVIRGRLYTRYPLFGRPTPPEPVEHWLDSLRGDDVRTVRRLVELLGRDDVDATLRDASMSQLVGMYMTTRAPAREPVAAPERATASP